MTPQIVNSFPNDVRGLVPRRSESARCPGRRASICAAALRAPAMPRASAVLPAEWASRRSASAGGLTTAVHRSAAMRRHDFAAAACELRLERSSSVNTCMPQVALSCKRSVEHVAKVSAHSQSEAKAAKRTQFINRKNSRDRAATCPAHANTRHWRKRAARAAAASAAERAAAHINTMATTRRTSRAAHQAAASCDNRRHGLGMPAPSQ